MKDSSGIQKAQIGDDFHLTDYFELLLMSVMGFLAALLFSLINVLLLPAFIWALIGFPFVLVVYPFRKNKYGYAVAKVIGIIFVYPLVALLQRMGFGH